MTATVTINAGICGFTTNAVVESEDEQNATFRISSDCDKITAIAGIIQGLGPLDAYQEISASQRSVLLGTFQERLTGCCAGCVVPAGLFKSLQVATQLALPQEVHMSVQIPTRDPNTP